MKKVYFDVILIVIFAALISAACTKKGGVFEAKQTVNNRTFILKANRNPISQGNNEFSIVIQDQSGKIIKAEFVHFRFFMKNTPAGAAGPSDIMTPADAKGDGYTVSVPLQISGDWNIEIEAAIKDVQEPITHITYTIRVI